MTSLLFKNYDSFELPANQLVIQFTFKSSTHTAHSSVPFSSRIIHHIMAFRVAASKLKSLALPRLGESRTISTNVSPSLASNSQNSKPRKIRPDRVPIYMVLGMATIVASLGIYTATHEVLHSPSVRVSKTKREGLPEVENPEVVVSDADKFVKKSVFRKLAHLKEHDHHDPSRYVETLDNAKVDSGLR